MNKTFAIAVMIAGIFGTAITFTELPKVFGSDQYTYEHDGNSYQPNQPYQQQQLEQSYDDKSHGYGSERNNYENDENAYPDEGYGPVFLAKISGENVRPEPTDSPINGFGEFKVEKKPSNGEIQLRYIISAFDVPKDEDIIAMHLHVINNEQNLTGAHIITLCGSPANEVECPEGPGVIAAGAALERDIEDDQTFITTMSQLIEALKAGLGYVQIHTTEIPEGAARGDLVEKSNDNNYGY